MLINLPKRGIDVLIGIALLALFLLPLFIDIPIERLREMTGENYLISALSFTALMFLATVVAPVTVPLAVPAAAPFLGPWQAALCAVVGWTLGAIVAFFIARHLGRRLAVSIVGEERLMRLESRIPEKNLFLWMVFLRMLLPVDVLSYALGLFPRVKVLPYTMATLIGIAPFAFVFAYAGEALLLKEYGRVVGFTMFGILLFLLMLVITRRVR